MLPVTDRLALPMLTAAQAQKEMTHNAALVRIDTLLQPSVLAVAPPAVPSAPQAGQCWIVGPAASGAWAGQADALATWTSGGWRFAAPFDGLAVWSVADGVEARFAGAAWRIGTVAAIAAPAGGTTVDAEARAAIAALLAALRTHGLIAT